MLGKITAVAGNVRFLGKNFGHANKINSQNAQTNSINSLMDSKAAATLNPLNFKGSIKLSHSESSFQTKVDGLNADLKVDYPGKDLGIRVNDFMGLKNELTITDKAAGEITFKPTEDGMEIIDGKKVVFRANFEDKSDLPDITFKKGKFNPEITIYGDKGLRVQMLAGSKIEAENYTLTMPGTAFVEKKGEKKALNFTGKTVVTTLNRENSTKHAVDSYMQSGLAQKTTKGIFAKEMANFEPTIVIPAGGFGTRFANMTEEEGENKPSYRLPTNDSYRIMATALNMGAMGGVIGSEDDELTYLSQGSDKFAMKEGDKNVIKVKAYKTDGGAIYAGLTNGTIPENKDMIVLNADIITNADITRAYNALKTLPNAGLVIPYYPVNAQRARSFGLMGAEFDANGNTKIAQFIEKPTHTDVEPTPEHFITNDKLTTFEAVKGAYEKALTARIDSNPDQYYGNPGIYVMSKEAAKVLRELGDGDENQTGLGQSVMPEIVRRANAGELLDENGNKLKAYMVPLQRQDGKAAFWDDIGSAEAYLDTIKKIASETTKKGTDSLDNFYYGIPEFVLSDFEKNTDLGSGIVYINPKARDLFTEFKEEQGIKYAKGNIFISD